MGQVTPDRSSAEVRSLRTAKSFQCRFCDHSVNFYVAILYHEIDVHSPELSCTICDSIFAKLCSHVRSVHGDGVVAAQRDEGEAEQNKEATFQKHLVRLDSTSTEEPTELVECDLRDRKCANTARGGQPDVQSVPDNVTARSSSIPPADDECFSGDEAISEKLLRHAAPISTEGAWEELHMKTIQETDTLLSKIDALSHELDKPYGGRFGPKGLLRDTRDSVFCTKFRDLDGQAEERREDGAAAAEMVKFLSEVEGSLQVVGPWRKTYRVEDVDRDPFLCSRCALPFATKSALMMHQYHVHGDDSAKVFRCKKCGKNYANRSYLVRHCAWIRFGKTFRCKNRTCDQHFTTGAERAQHLLETHGGIPCQYCGRRFTEWATWRLHLDMQHDQNKSVLTCRICHSAVFTRTVDLKKHERKCRLEINERVRCVEGKLTVGPSDTGKPKSLPSTASKDKMKAYMQQYWKQKRESEHKCTSCCVKCYSVEKRLRHELECHIPDGSGGMSHRCSECDAVFSQIKKLNAHMKTDHGYGKFKCPQCHKLYMTPAGVREHVAQQHTKVRFKCDQCGKEFARKHLYENHVAIHDGKAKYTCELCGMQIFHYATWYDHNKLYCPMLKNESRRGRAK